MLDGLKEQLNIHKQLNLHIKVRAGAKQTRVKSILSDGTIKIEIAVAPEDGKANDALIKFLKEEFAVNQSCIKIVAGKFSADKIVKITRVI